MAPKATERQPNEGLDAEDGRGLRWARCDRSSVRSSTSSTGPQCYRSYASMRATPLYRTICATASPQRLAEPDPTPRRFDAQEALLYLG